MRRPVPEPPIKTPMYLDNGAMSPVWVQWFQAIYDKLGGASTTAPINIKGTAAGEPL